MTHGHYEEKVSTRAVRENLICGSVPAEVGKTRALVQVLHRSIKPE